MCVGRIAERDGELCAWVEVAPREGSAAGPLAGVPFGAKDIFETRGMATEYGSPLFAGRKGVSDAVLVSELLGRGAVLLGKTATTAFACFDPAPTRNPHDGRYSPGGSSSGSAAAVAAGMVPFALGTQTQGSVLRPASFCGVTGFKPTFGALSTEGVLAFAPSLDTPGLFTESPADMVLLWERMGHASLEFEELTCAVPALAEGVDAGMEAAFRAATRGFPSVPMPDEFHRVLPAVRVVNMYEGARTHESLWRAHGARVGLKLAALIEEGLKIPESEYGRALAAIAEGKRAMESVFGEFAVLLTPAAPGPPPMGLGSTGDPRCNAAWTGLGCPAISIPMPREIAPGMPLGLQLTAAPGRDSELLAAAVRVADRMRDARQATCES
jgi:Asp-tRNA(Asn)/Glu-tRNA(Gln) amidotransferase A subunit family amidase